MKTSSAKSKGRRACQETKELLHKYVSSLEDGDIVVTPSGVTGVDVYLSPSALKKIPLTIECKNQESIQIWKALEQSESHAKCTPYSPALFFRRNRSDLYVALKAEDFIRMITKKEAPQRSESLGTDENSRPHPELL